MRVIGAPSVGKVDVHCGRIFLADVSMSPKEMSAVIAGKVVKAALFAVAQETVEPWLEDQHFDGNVRNGIFAATARLLFVRSPKALLLSPCRFVRVLVRGGGAALQQGKRVISARGSSVRIPPLHLHLPLVSSPI